MPFKLTWYPMRTDDPETLIEWGTFSENKLGLQRPCIRGLTHYEISLALSQ
jgi:hypothetical protein